jgi:hypothetical protein
MKAKAKLVDMRHPKPSPKVDPDHEDDLPPQLSLLVHAGAASTSNSTKLPIRGLSITDKPQCQPGFRPLTHEKSVTGNLNEGLLAAKELRICVTTSGDNEPITSLSSTVSDSCPPGQVKVGQVPEVSGNLNEGGGGKKVFLCKTTGTADPITGLFLSP